MAGGGPSTEFSHAWLAGKESVTVNQAATRWRRQAEGDLKAAETNLAGGSHEWACFQAQQAAEKALKALIYARGYTSVLTHSIKQLVDKCTEIGHLMDQHREGARRLDSYYIATRYPNLPAGDLAPVDYFDEEDASQCLLFARSILGDVKRSFCE